MRSLVLVACALATFGCVTTAPRQHAPPQFETVEVELTINDVDADLLKEVQGALAGVTEFRSAQLKSHVGRTAIFTVMYPGDLNDLPKRLSAIPNPGLKFVSSKHAFTYAAFDNQPPTIAFVFPQNEQVLNSKEQFITVEVPDKDVATVTIGGKPAPLYKGSIYRLKLDLVEGKQELIATAKDKSGNESSARVTVTIDTTAPALQAQIKLLIEGHVEAGSSVLIDGVEVPVDGSGNYRAEVPVRKGQRRVEIIAIDRSGNKSISVKTIGE